MRVPVRDSARLHHRRAASIAIGLCVYVAASGNRPAWAKPGEEASARGRPREEPESVRRERVSDGERTPETRLPAREEREPRDRPPSERQAADRPPREEDPPSAAIPRRESEREGKDSDLPKGGSKPGDGPGRSGEGKKAAAQEDGGGGESKEGDKSGKASETKEAMAEPAKEGQPTPWDGTGKHQPDSPGLFPDPPPRGPGGRGDGRPPGDLKKASEANPAFQFVSFGKDGSAAMCQMTRIDTSPFEDKRRSVENRKTESSFVSADKGASPDDECYTMSAAHCFQQRVDRGEEEGEWLARIASPQFGKEPFDVKVYTMPGYTPHMRAGGMRAYHVGDAVIVKLPGKVCAHLDKEEAPKLKLCTAADPNAAYFLMSHRLDKQSLVYDSREGDRVVPAGFSRSFARRPYSAWDRVIMQGDSGGPIVKIRNSSQKSAQDNWVCMSGAASTAPIVTSSWGAPSANYAAGEKVVKWLNDKTEKFVQARERARGPDRAVSRLDAASDLDYAMDVDPGGGHRF